MKPYFPAIDSLRFFASINIVLLHLSSSSLLSYANGTFFEPIIIGPLFNTSVFFLLSGFIHSILFSKQEKVPKLKPFLKKRFLRLYPLHITCTLIVFAIIFYRTSVLHDTAYAIKTLALHISLLWAFVPELGHPLNQPSWALSVFFLCYALTPAFSRFLNRQGKKNLWLLFFTLWAISFLSVAYFEELSRVFNGIHFFTGMLLGRLFLNDAIPLPKKNVLYDLFLLFTAILLYANARYLRLISPDATYYITSPILYSLLLLFLANNKGFMVKILSVSWLRILGKVSFYTYLLHVAVIQVLHLYLDRVSHWEDNIFNRPSSTAIIMILLYGGCAVFYLIKNK
ncbi:MAG: acyltransferase [Fibromonadaceae bacterium]|jgi:peptidoglycan/LPS O-acetylase OafA/YrhL|nr:acyltransferase [Fibromonadaceae bacterium]